MPSSDALAQTAVLFPGQGSQTPTMKEDLAAIRPDLVDLACEIVGEDPFDRVGDGTQFQQPAIFAASLGGWEHIRHAVEPTALAGHSLGELSALTVAGAISEQDALGLVAARGRLMQQAAQSSSASGMLAVRASRESVNGVLSEYGLTVANHNAPEQVVIAGALDAIGLAAERLRGDGVRSVKLPVAGAFHSSFMAPAAKGLASHVAKISFAAPRIPVYSCLTAKPFEDIANAIVDGLTRPVRWFETLCALDAAGITSFVETGPGKVLTGLVRRSLPNADARTAAELETAHA